MPEVDAPTLVLVQLDVKAVAVEAIQTTQAAVEAVQSTSVAAAVAQRVAWVPLQARLARGAEEPGRAAPARHQQEP